MDLNNINPQWIWIGAAVVGVLLLLALASAMSRRRAAGRIRPLAADARERFRADWRKVEEMFVDRPATAVMQADELVNDLIRTRGLSNRHSRVADRYRSAKAAIDRHSRGRASTEDLRQALLHYRGIYDDLGGERTDVAQAIPTAAEIAPPSRAEVRQDERPRV
jgi:hypothetical protein